MGGLAVAMSQLAVAFALVLFATFVVLGGATVMVSRRLVVKGGVAMMGSPTALASGLSACFGIELMPITALMGSSPTTAGNFALLFGIHGREAAGTILVVFLRHEDSPGSNRPLIMDQREGHAARGEEPAFFNSSQKKSLQNSCRRVGKSRCKQD
jgi:hypothetical protein